MRKNPYEQGDELSRNDNWGLQEGLIDEVVVDKDKTVQYYYVLTFDNDRVLCKTLNPFAGPGYGAVYPFFKGDHVVIGFINNNPNCQAFILGGVHDRARTMPKEDDVSLEDARIYVPKDHKIVEKSNNKVSVVNKTTKDADDGNHLIYAERGLQISAGAQCAINNAKPPQSISEGILINTCPDGRIKIESGGNISLIAENDIYSESKKDVYIFGEGTDSRIRIRSKDVYLGATKGLDYENAVLGKSLRNLLSGLFNTLKTDTNLSIASRIALAKADDDLNFILSPSVNISKE